MRYQYSKKTLERFFHPKNMKKMRNPDGIGKAGNPICGDIMEIYIKIGRQKRGEKEYIKEVSFTTLGCPAAIATSDMICDLVKGKTIEEALKIGYKDIANKLGTLPPQKIHCAHLAEQGLKAAIDDYKKKLP